MSALRWLWRCGFAFTLVHCTGVAPTSPPAAAVPSPILPEAPLDWRFEIAVGASAELTTGTTFALRAFTGPVECVEGTCLTSPATAEALLTQGDADYPLDISMATFRSVGGFAIGYLGAVSSATGGGPAGRFRVVAERFQTADLGERFRLSVTAPVELPDGHIVRATAFSDSRCSGFAVCVWRGVADISVTIFEGGEALGTVTFDDLVGTAQAFGDDTGVIGPFTLEAEQVSVPEDFMDEGFVDLRVRK